MQIARSIVRPLVTVALVGAFIAAVFTRGDAEIAAIGGPMGIILGWWFKERSASKAG